MTLAMVLAGGAAAFRGSDGRRGRSAGSGDQPRAMTIAIAGAHHAARRAARTGYDPAPKRVALPMR